MKQVLTIAFQSAISQRIRQYLVGLANQYTLCGAADNTVVGMSLIEATEPDIVIMSAKMEFWDADSLINHLISQGFCPYFILLCNGPHEVGRAASSKVAAILPETTFTEQQLAEALQRAETRIQADSQVIKDVRPVNNAVQHSLEVMELLMGLTPVQTQAAQQKYGRLRVGQRDCWLILGSPNVTASEESDYLSDLNRLEDLIQSLTILLRPLGACEICVFRETNLCILLEAQPGLVPDWDLWLGKINQHMETVNLHPLLFEISDTPLPLEQWQGCCRELLRLREARFFYSPLYLQPKMRESHRKFVSHERIHSRLSALNQAMQAGSPEAIQKTLAELEAMVSSTLSRDVYSFVTSQMVLQYSNLCYSLQLDSQTQMELTFRFRPFVSVDDFFSAYRQKIFALLEIMTKDTTGNGTIAKVCQYIQQHLSEDLNLELLAGHAFVSTSYLSRLFKKEMNIALSAYISQQRIQKAIQLLNTNSGISNLAAAVGFDNPKYFSQVFKKITGKTPQEYRKELQGGTQ